MQKESTSLAEFHRKLIRAYTDTFVPRTDIYPMQIEDGSYITVKKRLDYEYVSLHLQGKPTLGAYALDAISQAQWICLDADTEQQWHQLHGLASHLTSDEIPVYLEQSRRGGHLWLFTSKIAGSLARQFAYQLLHEQDIEDIEVYPKQDELKTGPGSLVRLPLGIHRKTNKRYHFVDLQGQPLAPTIREQVALLSKPDRVPLPYIQDIVQHAPIKNEHRSPTPHLRPTNNQDQPLSEQLKQATTVYEFVSQYVELDQRGRSHCPFHEDTHKSFGVNEEGNYWHCWAGCGGGSIIDFWMRWREKQGQDGSFIATIRDMAQTFFGS